MTDGRVARRGAAFAAIDDPAQYPQVLAEPRPQELPGVVLAEPVDVEDSRRRFEFGADVDPVRPVVAEVVAGEGLHGHGIAANHPDGIRGGCRRLGGDPGTHQHAVQPIAGLVNQRRQCAAAAAEHDGRNRHAAGSIGKL